MANRFLNNITINDEYALPSTDGTADQIITTDGAGRLSFVDQSTLVSGSTERVSILVKNGEGTALVKGDPVYIIGSVGASARLEVGLCDASDPSKMPCVGLLEQDLLNNGEGTAVTAGKLRNLITTPIDGQPTTENDTIYVKAGGSSGSALTTTKPTGSTNLIQNVGQVGRASTSSDGNLVVSAIMRTNDVPNLPTGKIWVGDGNTIVSTVVHLDETNGRMGIGTTSPSAKLHVDGSATFTGNVGVTGTGNLTIRNTSSTGSGIIFLDNIWQAGIEHDSGKLYFRTGGQTDRMTIHSSGNVGIGTTSPAYKLDVRNSSTLFYGQTDLTDTTSIFRIRANGGSSEILEIEANGNVGIGTASPQEKLDISAGSIRLDDNLSIKWASVDANVGRVRITGNEVNDYLTFVTDNSEKMRLTNTGLGIGTTSPYTKLEVVGIISSGAGPSAANLGMEFGGLLGPAAMPSQIRGVIGALNSGTGVMAGSIGYQPRTGVGASHIFFTEQSEKMRITSTGNVGIDNASPSYLLDVAGDGRVNGTFRCVSLIQTSQRDQKTEIELVGKETTSLPIKRYKYKSGDNNKLRYGVVAEDIESSYPELVETDAEGIKGVKYIDFLVRKIAELETEKRTLVNWRHYHSNKSYNMLYDTGMTTAFPYAYGSIPAPYDMYFTSFTLINNPYSSYNKGPEGDTAIVQAYVNNTLVHEIRDIRYGNNPFESITVDFGQNVALRQGEALQIRFQANGPWRYCNSTIILTER